MNLAVIGLQFGDEGKGKIVDFLAERFDIVARFSGGSNAGHTVIHEGREVRFHLLPSGVLRGKIGVLGNGMVIDPAKFREEVEILRDLGVNPDLKVSRRAHIVTGFHRMLDARDDEVIGIGTTRQGIGPAYVAKFRRIGIRAQDVLNGEILEKKLRMLARLFSLDIGDAEIREERKRLQSHGEFLRNYLEDVEVWLNRAMDSGRSVLFEGSQGTFLDVDFGTYPFVTSSSTTVGGVLTGLGVPPGRIDGVLGITKAYTTRVGSGPFPTEINGEEAEFLRGKGHEYGATTGRPRRVGYLDLPMLRYASMINGVTEIALTKVDVLYSMDEVPVAMRYRCDGAEYDYPPARVETCSPLYEYFPGWESHDDENLAGFVSMIERETGAKVTIISYGPGREETVLR